MKATPSRDEICGGPVTVGVPEALQPRQHVTLSDVITELTPAQARRIVALLGLAQPRRAEVPDRNSEAA